MLNDKRLLREGKILIAEEFDKVLDRNKRELIITHSFQLIIPNTYGRYNYIGFINDGQTVVIDKCKSWAANQTTANSVFAKLRAEGSNFGILSLIIFGYRLDEF